MLRRRLVFWWLISVIPIAGIVVGLLRPEDYGAVQSRYQALVASFGPASWLGLILLQIGQVVVTPFNHYVVGVLGGFLFGPHLGGLLNWTGRVIGHSLAFLLAHRLGRPLVLRFVGKEELDKYDQLVGGQGLLLCLIYYLPFFPDDELSYLAGLSRMRFVPFLIANVLGHIGGSWSLAYFGAGVETYDPFFWALQGISVVGFPILWWAWRRGAATHKADARY